MSVIDLAVRLSTVMALRGKTLAGLNVLDEPLDPVADCLAIDPETGEQAGEARAMIAVYTSLSVAKVIGNDLLAADRDIEVTIQVYLPDTVRVNDGTADIIVDTRKAGAKTIMDIIERQIERVLLVDDSPWALLRRQFQFKLFEVRSQSFIVATDLKLKVAAKELVLKMDTLSSPNFGDLLPVWTDFITLLKTEPGIGGLADYIEKEIKSSDLLPDWQAAQAALGVWPEAVDPLGINQIPALPLTGEEIAELEELFVGDDSPVGEGNPVEVEILE